MLRFDLENESETIRQYRRRVKQCEALSEFAIAEHLNNAASPKVKPLAELFAH